MARIRSIKPEFWTDEKVVALTPLARLLFIGLWNFVDDEGRGSFSPRRLKMQILPADDADITALLDEIRRESLIVVYTAGDKEYFEVCGFTKHQKVDKRTASRLPPPNSPELPRNPTTDQGGEGIKEGKGEQATQHIPRAKEKGNRTKAWFDELESSLREAAGLENDPSPTLFDVSPMVALLDKGYDLAADILPKLKAAKARNKRGSSWAYYVPAITEGKAANGSIAPKATETKGPPHIWVTEEDPRWRPLADRWKSVKGHDPPVRGSRYEPGQGHHFPAEWIEARP